MTSGHALTLFGKMARRPPRIPLRRMRLRTPDADFVDVDVLDGDPGAPMALLLHGLEGSSQSEYIQSLLGQFHVRRWSAVALNFRSCSGQMNFARASYSSGDTRDVSWLVPQMDRLARTIPGPRVAVGFSLGASVLLNFLAQEKSSASLSAAVAVSAPFDLDASATYLDSTDPFASVYRSNFLESLIQKGLLKAQRFSSLLDADAIARVKTIREFDHRVTALTFGFASAEEYYRKSSSGSQLKDIEVPTLLISAEDDALAPAGLLPQEVHELRAIHLLQTQTGGHVGFVSGSVLRPSFWLEQRIMAWLTEQLL